MFGAILGGIAGTALGLIGANRAKKSSEGANNYNKDLNAQQMQFAREQFDYQKELNQKQIQYRVKDAQAAGLHPLAALGVSPMSYSPVGASSIPATGSDYSGYSSVASMLPQLGQNIDSAVMNAQTKQERKEALALQTQGINLDLRGKSLNNQILQLEIASRWAKLQQQLNPAVPERDPWGVYMPGQGNAPDDLGSPTSSALVGTSKPQESVRTMPGASSLAIPDPDRGYKWTGSGYAPYQEQGSHENEDSIAGSIGFFARNHVGPMLGNHDTAPPPELLPDKGAGRYEWAFSIPTQQWVAIRTMKSFKGEPNGSWKYFGNGLRDMFWPSGRHYKK